MAADDDGVTVIIKKVLTTTDPWWWLAALALLVGLPIFCLKLPETITAISSYHDTHRKTTHKIRTDKAKLERALAGRTPKNQSAGKGKK